MWTSAHDIPLPLCAAWLAFIVVWIEDVDAEDGLSFWEVVVQSIVVDAQIALVPDDRGREHDRDEIVMWKCERAEDSRARRARVPAIEASRMETRKVCRPASTCVGARPWSL